MIAFIDGIGSFVDAHGSAIAAVSTVFVAAFTYTLWRATNKLWRSSIQHSEHLESSLAHASRSAAAMEKVSHSLQTSAQITSEMAERQRIVSELQNRAYLSVVYIGIVPQNRDTGYRYEPRIGIINGGHTPAYDVTIRAQADVCSVPLPEDFTFPLPGAESIRSISVIGPQQNKIYNCPLPRLYSVDEEVSFKGGVTQRIYLWGLVKYRDAFQINRQVRFCQSVIWMADQQTTMAVDTNRHNDSD